MLLPWSREHAVLIKKRIGQEACPICVSCGGYIYKCICVVVDCVIDSA